jgi:anhydro-N-acetylmuramic acid kinase
MRQQQPPKARIVAGVMSGTSADGVDVALVRISPGTGEVPRIKLLGHCGFAYPRPVREAVLAAMDAQSMSVADMSRLHWRLGEIYADCIEKTATKFSLKPALIGLHGQTIYHQAHPERFLGRPVRTTWQIGEPAVIAERLKLPVVSDFRPADLAAGGQGAPLVPMLDYCLFRSATKSRVLLNLGGIANVTAIPAGAGLDGLLAFDTGPANMLIDGLMQAAFRKEYDRAGKVAARGRVLKPVLDELLKQPFFAAAPPKSCGREEFGAAFLDRMMKLSAAAGGNEMDAVATATELTVASILDAYARFCWPHLGQRAPLARATELIAAGGGVRNSFMMSRLRERFAALGVRVLTADDVGVGAQSKEAVAFALLAWLTWHNHPGNVPAATGASRPVVLGKVSFG